MAFIKDEKVLSKLFNSIINEDETKPFDQVVKELYEQIEYTRRMSYKNGYEQGRFDEKAEFMNQKHEDYERK
ncbi:hypothetical protein P4V41_07985 [Fictibacillus nanhaiensis]|uniref:hypothetical protein n=1 Tax=Fictibacillus nanhaiensis TaxID=742169 RepID=UPI002E200F6D|nr:hypothetical protein [Fictibacillus nanhaiensis]